MQDNRVPRCSNGACVDIKPVEDEFLFTSTKGADKGETRYDRPELIQFFADVKAGKWDHLLGDDGGPTDHGPMVA